MTSLHLLCQEGAMRDAYILLNVTAVRYDRCEIQNLANLA